MCWFGSSSGSLLAKGSFSSQPYMIHLWTSLPPVVDLVPVSRMTPIYIQFHGYLLNSVMSPCDSNFYGAIYSNSYQLLVQSDIWCGRRACRYEHAPLQCFWWVLHVSDTVAPQMISTPPVVKGKKKLYLTTSSRSCDPTLLAVGSTSGALHRWGGDSDDPPPSLSPPVRLNGSHVSLRGPEVNV